MRNDIIIRPATENDMPFFWSSLLNHYKHSSQTTALIPAGIYFWNQQRVINQALKRAGNFINCAVVRDDPDTVLGYVWGNESPQTCYYVYVKRPFRAMGIARLLMEESYYYDEQVFLGMLSFDGARIFRKYRELVYNPWVMDENIWNQYQSILDEDEDALEKIFRKKRL